MINTTNTIASRLFLKSTLCRDEEYTSIEKVIGWLEEQNNKVDVNINPCPLRDIEGWMYSQEKGSIRHNSGKFFSIDGIQVRTNCSEAKKWQQPIINQPEIGFLGIITKEINGVLHFLLQAKIEPGNINYVQLSPTLQATRSNYTQVHKGREPLYLDYFRNAKPEQILVDQLQSEQGGRFLQKRNRNIIIKTDEKIIINDQFIWLTLYQIKLLMGYDNLVNMDTRSVISCATFGDQDPSVFEIISFLAYERKGGIYERDFLRSSLTATGGLHTIDEIITFLTIIKSQCDLVVKKVKLEKLEEWIFGDMEIYHQEYKYFKVIAVDVEIGNREVIRWSQPLVQPVQQGLCAFVAKKINGIIHFIVQAKIESGNMDVVEFAPTVQSLTGDYRNSKGTKLPYLEDVINAENDRIIVDSLQSEEGGRFYKDQNRYVIVMANEGLQEKLPNNYIWMTLNQLQMFLKLNNFLNIQARSLIAAIPFI
jgi:dTDP-4-dehydro-6-deoxy-alpha-D-glucopyranose 2,3-dehydratase